MPTAPCPACGSTSRVTIGKKDYCTNCGTQLSGQPDAMPATSVAVTANPAQAFHAAPVATPPSTHVLDLRQTPDAAAAPAPASSATASPTVAISKFHNPNAKPTATAVDIKPTQKKVIQPPASTPTSPTPALTDLAAPAPAPAQPEPAPAAVSMPPAIATAIGANNNLLQTAATTTPATPVAAKPATVALAAVGLALLGGYVWLKNYPNLALRVAATKAGISAAIPAYLPSGYSLSGQVGYSQGEVSAAFNSPSGTGNLTITQRRTNWDSNSLLENFVAKQGNDFLAVQREGLTIYFYGQNQVTWINHGIWYTIEGNNKLTRDQVLSIVDSF